MNTLTLDEQLVKAAAMLVTFAKAGGIHNMPEATRKMWLEIPLEKRMEALKVYGTPIAGFMAGEEYE